MKRIFKYDVQLMGTGPQSPRLWALVDPDATPEIRRFRVIGTGHEIQEPERMNHVGSFIDGPTFDKALLPYTDEVAKLGHSLNNVHPSEYFQP